MKRSHFVYLATKGITRSIFPMFYRIETEGNGEFPAHGPAVILPKHQYWTDIPMVSLAFEPLLHFVAKKELFKYPLIRQYLSFLGGIPLDRKHTLRTLDSFRILLALLKAGEKIVIFPEGTYSRNTVGTGRSRLVKMILSFQSDLKQRIPFIPVGIRYGERVGWRRRVIICIGAPLFAEAGADAACFNDQVMDEISRLCQLPRNKTA
jgi:1-acyl-sn-glycerol-3-phosphate acyltransferase